MIRKLLIQAFILAAVSNSLAAVAPVIAGEGECGAACCKAAHRQKPSALLSKLCCLTDCNQPAETQSQSGEGLLRSDRNKSHAPVVIAVQALFSDQPSSFLHSSSRNVIHSTPIYLRTGTLLI